jgi:SAM-dependent methyltransferase
MQELRARSDAPFFRRVAKRGWQKSGHFTFTSEFPALRRWLADRLPQKQRVLTIGCGMGELEHLLRRQGHQVVGIDVVYEMLKAARQQGFTRGAQADAHFLPFPAVCFDIVILPETLGYIRVGRVFCEVARVLTTRGRFVITTYPLHFRSHATYRKLSSAQVMRALDRAGFVVRERRFLIVKPRDVREADAERSCSLLYLMAKKRPHL